MRCIRIFIYGFLESDYLEYGNIKDNFDWGILNELVECTNEEEFKLKLANLAEIRTINESKYGTYYFLLEEKNLPTLKMTIIEVFLMIVSN